VRLNLCPDALEIVSITNIGIHTTASGYVPGMINTRLGRRFMLLLPFSLTCFGDHASLSLLFLRLCFRHANRVHGSVQVTISSLAASFSTMHARSQVMNYASNAIYISFVYRANANCAAMTLVRVQVFAYAQRIASPFERYPTARDCLLQCLIHALDWYTGLASMPSSVGAFAAAHDHQILLPRDFLAEFSIWCTRLRMLSHSMEDLENTLSSVMKQVPETNSSQVISICLRLPCTKL